MGFTLRLQQTGACHSPGHGASALSVQQSLPAGSLGGVLLPWVWASCGELPTLPPDCGLGDATVYSWSGFRLPASPGRLCFTLERKLIQGLQTVPPTSCRHSGGEGQWGTGTAWPQALPPPHPCGSMSFVPWSPIQCIVPSSLPLKLGGPCWTLPQPVSRPQRPPTSLGGAGGWSLSQRGAGPPGGPSAPPWRSREHRGC